ncbi:hypothetical protein [Sorangium sp. So ce131]
MSTEELLAQVLLLPRHERARLAEEVLSSLEEWPARYGNAPDAASRCR